MNKGIPINVRINNPFFVSPKLIPISTNFRFNTIAESMEYNIVRIANNECNLNGSDILTAFTNIFESKM